MSDEIVHTLHDVEVHTKYLMGKSFMRGDDYVKWRYFLDLRAVCLANPQRITIFRVWTRTWRPCHPSCTAACELWHQEKYKCVESPRCGTASVVNSVCGVAIPIAHEAAVVVTVV